MTSRITSVGIRGVVHERLGADRDLVAEDGGDLVGVAGAADVAQQRHPVRGLAQLLGRTPRPRRSRSRADTTAVATRAAGRTRCPAQAPAWRRIHRGEAVCRRWGVLPMYRPLTAEHNPLTTRGWSLRATDNAQTQGRTSWRHRQPRADPIKVGVIADQTGPLSFVGLANANVARMVIGDINAKGGLLGRQLELYLEDGATDDAVAAAKATQAGRAGQRRRRLRRHLQLHAAGHQGAGRRGGQDALHLPGAVRGGRSPIRSSSAPARCRRSRSTRSSRG